MQDNDENEFSNNVPAFLLAPHDDVDCELPKPRPPQHDWLEDIFSLAAVIFFCWVLWQFLEIYQLYIDAAKATGGQ